MRWNDKQTLPHNIFGYCDGVRVSNFLKIRQKFNNYNNKEDFDYRIKLYLYY